MNRERKGQDREATPRLRGYRLFGTTLASDLAFISQLEPTEDEACQLILRQDAGLAPADLAGFKPRFQSPPDGPEGECLLSVLARGGEHLLRFTRVVDFLVGEREILYRSLDPVLAYLIEIRFLGPVMALWLERQGLPALHASAVAIGKGAVAFLGNNGGGKTSLAAALMAAGCPLLSDDVVAVEGGLGLARARPAYPQLRMEPDLAACFLGDEASGLERFHPLYPKLRVPAQLLGGFGAEPRPLSRLYLPERRQDGTGDIRIVPISARDAFVELLRHSFLDPDLLHALGWQARRFDALAQLAEEAPMFRLLYPSGLEHLPRVAAVVQAAG